MKRLLILMIGLMAFYPFSPAQAERSPDPGTVVGLYECMHVDPATDHFTCSWENSDNQFHLQWLVNVTQLPTEERRTAMYHFSKLALDIVQYGNTYQLSFKYNPGKTHECQRASTGYIAITCD